MNDATPSLSETYRAGRSSQRIQPPPSSAEGAKARMVRELDHLEENCRVGLDISYAEAAGTAQAQDACGSRGTSVLNV